MEMLREFHDAFREPVQDRPRADNVPERTVRLRRRLVKSEVRELLEALRGPQPDLPHVAKELADVLYVVYGTAVALGIPLGEVLLAVHESNMSKRGPNGEIEYDEGGKVLKGPWYAEPDVAAVIYETREVLWVEGGRVDRRRCSWTATCARAPRCA